MIIRRTTYITLFLLISLLTPAQEVLTGLSGNSKLNPKASPFPISSKASGDTLDLPFYDDFSYKGPYPDSTLWSDKFVFINNTLTVSQLTQGVATFDQLDHTGRLYEDASTFVTRCDVLTSKPINLDFPASDNIWFSFYYQPAGIGEAPEPNDSLTLDFYSPETEMWYSIWHDDGSAVKPFTPVILQVTESMFLKKGFRFRFTGYGSLTQGTTDPSLKTSGDNWHIDNVVLDRNRDAADITLHDVAFTLPVRSLLKNHESMPLKHFRQVYLSEMGSSISVNYLNNDDVIRNVTRQFEIRDLNTGTVVHSFSGGATNIDPNQSVGYPAPLFYTFNLTGPDTVTYEVKSFLITDVFDPKLNDTIIYLQQFGNVFAIDDGSAEAGYGISGQGSANAMVAYRFRAYVPDSLRAIEICFNDSYQNANLTAFDIAVWDNDNGSPGNLIYLGENEMVQQGAGTNGFHTYQLNDPVFIDNVFFVGWKQRSDKFLNAGVDLNTSHNNRQFYWINGNWYQSEINGTLMIRAVTGPKIVSTAISDITPFSSTIKIWPNPVRDILNISVDERFTQYLSFRIIDITGRVIMDSKDVSYIDVSHLSSGIYILLTLHQGVPIARARFIKTY